MTNEFNKNRMLENISFLLKELGKKIGELEAEAGVSPGYISRISKDEKTKPGIEFIMKVADSLNVSVDTLLSSDLVEMTPTERYLMSFLEKLIKDTVDDKLDWNIESVDSLNRIEADRYGNSDHPLFSNEPISVIGEAGYPEEYPRVVFVSNIFGLETVVIGDCYNLRLKNGSILYLMNIRKKDFELDDPCVFAKEFWMYTPGVGKNFLCSNIDASQLASLAENLFKTVSERMKHPRINKKLQYVIDAFMKDDLSDDVTPLPFDL